MSWERWSGGRVWVARDGKRTYYGEVRGRMVSTRCHSEADALAALLRLNTDAAPVAWAPLNERYRAEYLQECRRRGLHPQSINEKRRHLEDWARAIGTQRPTLQLLNRISARLSGRRGRIATLKAYYTWLRQEGRVRRQEDPTLDLRKPPSPGRDWDRLVPMETHRALVDGLEPRWSDLLVVLSGTGWHVTELLRFVRSGKIEGDVLVCPKHKSGEPHRTQVSQRVLEAARRARGRGGFGTSLFYRACREKADELGLTWNGPGGYRHTVATNAVRNGATPEAVAHFLGHKGSYMVKAIYAKVVVPRRVPTLE